MSSRLRLYCVFSAFAFVVFAAFTAGDYGLSWDEPFRWRSGDQKLDYYEQLFSSDEPLTVMSKASNDLYPGLYDLPLALARRHLDVDKVALSRIWNVAWAALALISTVLLARVTIARPDDKGLHSLSDWLALAPALVLVCSPEFFGHLFINPKDIPFAATYTLGIWAMVKLFDDLPNFSRVAWIRFAVCLGLVMAIRPPGIVVYCYLILFVGLWWCLERKEFGKARSLKLIPVVVGRSVAALFVAFAVVFPWWPSMHRNPFAASGQAVEKLHTFASAKPVLFGGEFYDAGSTPFYYTSWMFFAKIPEWFGLLVIVGCVLALIKWRDIVARFLERDIAIWRLTIVAFAFLFPIFWVTVSQAAIHNGYRHMLYTLPAAAIFAVATWKFLWVEVATQKRHRMIMLFVSGICVLFSVSYLYKLHPYQYIYYNAMAGGVPGSYGKYETEYWFTVGKEGAEALNRFMQEVSPGASTRVFVSGPQSVVEPFVDEGIEFVNKLEDADFYIGRPVNDPLVVNGIEIYRVVRIDLPILTVVALRK